MLLPFHLIMGIRCSVKTYILHIYHPETPSTLPVIPFCIYRTSALNQTRTPQNTPRMRFLFTVSISESSRSAIAEDISPVFSGLLFAPPIRGWYVCECVLGNPAYQGAYKDTRRPSFFGLHSPKLRQHSP